MKYSSRNGPGRNDRVRTHAMDNKKSPSRASLRFHVPIISCPRIQSEKRSGSNAYNALHYARRNRFYSPMPGVPPIHNVLKSIGCLSTARSHLRRLVFIESLTMSESRPLRRVNNVLPTGPNCRSDDVTDPSYFWRPRILAVPHETFKFMNRTMPRQKQSARHR